MFGLTAIVAAGTFAGAVYFIVFGDSEEFSAAEFGTNGACFGQLVNKTEREIRDIHGEPQKEWDEYRPMGHNGDRDLPSGRIKTLVFSGRGGFNNRDGTIWVCFVERWRGWVCFESVWIGNSVMFGQP